MNRLSNNRRKAYPVIVCVLLATAFFSCRKLVEVVPKGIMSDKAVFADSANAAAVVAGLYVKIQTATSKPLLTGSVTMCTGLSSDELRPFDRADLIPLYANSLTNADYSVSAIWFDAYQVIYPINACIEGVKASPTLSDALKVKLIAEAKLLRALCYFNMVNLFGDVPLVISTDYQENGSKPRTPQKLIWDQITRDLTDARDGLPGSYFTAGRFRANKYAALALLARVYLYQEQWSNAEAAVNQITDQTATYQLLTELNDVFKPSSKEVIWQFKPILFGNETAEGVAFIPTSASVHPTYAISTQLLNAFETGDQRKLKWLGKNTLSDNGTPVDFYYPFKYKLGRDNWTTDPVEGYTILRLGELYLIRAEARVKLGKLTGANSAQSDLNVIRERAGLSDATASTESDLMAAILHERQVELFCEWGHRWFDLKRTKAIDTVMPAVTTSKGGSWNSNKQVYPIPFSEIKYNPFLTQNPGYN